MRLSKRWMMFVLIFASLFGLLTSALIFADPLEDVYEATVSVTAPIVPPTVPTVSTMPSVPTVVQTCIYLGDGVACMLRTPIRTDGPIFPTPIGTNLPTFLTPVASGVFVTPVLIRDGLIVPGTLNTTGPSHSSVSSSDLDSVATDQLLLPLASAQMPPLTPTRQRERFLTDADLESYDFCAISLKRGTGSAAIYTRPNTTSATHGFLTDTRLVQMLGLHISGNWLEVMALYRLDTPQDDAIGYIPYDDQLEAMLRRNAKCSSVWPIAETAIPTEKSNQ